jgi:hypothetical protein
MARKMLKRGVKLEYIVEDTELPLGFNEVIWEA